MAKEAGLVQTVDKNAKPATPDQPTTTTPSNNNNTDPTKNTVPTAGQNPTSLQTQFQLLTQQIAQTTAQFRQVLQQQLQFSQSTLSVAFSLERGGQLSRQLVCQLNWSRNPGCQGAPRLAANLIKKLEANLVEACFIINFTILPGKSKLEQLVPVYSVLEI